MSTLSPVYVATVNVPGYLPEREPTAFETAREAWSHLADERRRDEDQDESASEYSDTVTDLDRLAFGCAVRDGRLITGHRDGGDAPGTVYADTPGSDSPHDLGLAYVVSLVAHADYPHGPGYLVDCPAREAMCHCTPGSAECVYGGDHE